MSPYRFFKSRDPAQKRELSPSGHDQRRAKRAKNFYDHEYSYDSEQEQYEADYDDGDSGLEDSSSFLYRDDTRDSTYYINYVSKPILNKSATPNKTLQRSELNISTSTPIKKRHENNSSEKYDLWEKAMSDDPKLRQLINKFQQEFDEIEKSEPLFIIDTPSK